MAGIPFLKKETKQLHQYASNLKLNACYYSRKWKNFLQSVKVMSDMCARAWKVKIVGLPHRDK